MKISMEMSLYPLKGEHIPDIAAFIDHLNKQPAIEVVTNSLSTQVSGEFDNVMRAVQTCLKTAFESGSTFSLVSKTLNIDITESEFY